ncbi:MAG: hypothetical protein ACRDRQ_07525 [Pseudonocardiaceae bacterium]
MVGDTRETHRAMLEAQRSYESLRPEGEPLWQDSYTEAAFAADLARAWVSSGRLTRPSS